MAEIAVRLIRAPINVVASLSGVTAAGFSNASYTNVQITESLTGIMATVPEADKNRILLYFHGGGHWLLTPSTYKEFIGRLSQATGACVVAVAYRKPPSVQFPAGLDDAMDAWKWAHQNPEARVAVAGDSSGANLAFSLLVKLAQLKETQPVACVGISPWLRLDLEWSLGNAYGMFCANLYLGGQSKITTAADPLVTIPNADSELLRQFPPILMHAGSNELTTPDVKEMYKVLEGVDSRAEVEFYDCPHIFQVGIGFPKSSRDSLTKIGDFLNRHWQQSENSETNDVK